MQLYQFNYLLTWLPWSRGTRTNWTYTVWSYSCKWHLSAHLRIPTASLGLAYTGLGRVVWETPWHEPWNTKGQYFSIWELIFSWHWFRWGSVKGSWEVHFQRRAHDVRFFWAARTTSENFLQRAGRIIKRVLFTFVWGKEFLIFWVRIFLFL